MTGEILDAKFHTIGRFWESMPYDIANKTMSCRVDGACIRALSLLGSHDALSDGGHYGTVGLADAHCEKHTWMYGRVQITDYVSRRIAYRVKCFVGDRSPVLYMAISGEGGAPFTLEYNFGCLRPPGRLAVRTDGVLTEREREGEYFHYTVTRPASLSGGRYTARFVIAFDPEDASVDRDILESALAAEQEAEAYFAGLQSLSADSEYPALKVFALNAALSSYKEIGDFQGFFAGVNYASPARTYYRDGYYTALPLLRVRPDWVRRQLLTLLRGIGPDGVCGSAVDAFGNPWWRDHWDSPLFFALLLYAYVADTGDRTILEEQSGGRSMAEALKTILGSIAGALDENGLLFRKPMDRHDWADNVYREGYVTYIECLAYGALHLASRLLSDPEDFYESAARQMKKAINEHLWDEHLGYYVNYKSPDCTEDNLSIDTVFAVLFGIADDRRAELLLKNMERLLETRHNGSDSDFGVQCIKPCYQYPSHLVEKSAYPLRYHNGAEWPYLSCLYAFARKMRGMDYRYPLTRWFEYGIGQGFYTPVEYHSPFYPPGGMLQAWSGFAAFTIDRAGPENIFQ